METSVQMLAAPKNPVTPPELLESVPRERVRIDHSVGTGPARQALFQLGFYKV